MLLADTFLQAPAEFRPILQISHTIQHDPARSKQWQTLQMHHNGCEFQAKRAA
jgi:hypothetical protein